MTGTVAELEARHALTVADLVARHQAGDKVADPGTVFAHARTVAELEELYSRLRAIGRAGRHELEAARHRALLGLELGIATFDEAADYARTASTFAGHRAGLMLAVELATVHDRAALAELLA